ncbi:KSR2 Kinase, partial [Crotophaga sulcirostris]|nr:KSR2 Kinase [Crotophaga sulcirostris]
GVGGGSRQRVPQGFHLLFQSKLVKYFSRQLSCKKKVALQERNAKLEGFPQLLHWFRIVDIRKEVMEEIAPGQLSLEELLDMTDDQVCATVEKFGANSEECARLNASLSCLRSVHKSGGSLSKQDWTIQWPTTEPGKENSPGCQPEPGQWGRTHLSPSPKVQPKCGQHHCHTGSPHGPMYTHVDRLTVEGHPGLCPPMESGHRSLPPSPRQRHAAHTPPRTPNIVTTMTPPGTPPVRRRNKLKPPGTPPPSSRKLIHLIPGFTVLHRSKSHEFQLGHRVDEAHTPNAVQTTAPLCRHLVADARSGFMGRNFLTLSQPQMPSAGDFPSGTSFLCDHSFSLLSLPSCQYKPWYGHSMAMLTAQLGVPCSPHLTTAGCLAISLLQPSMSHWRVSYSGTLAALLHAGDAQASCFASGEQRGNIRTGSRKALGAVGMAVGARRASRPRQHPGPRHLPGARVPLRDQRWLSQLPVTAAKPSAGLFACVGCQRRAGGGCHPLPGRDPPFPALLTFCPHYLHRPRFHSPVSLCSPLFAPSQNEEGAEEAQESEDDFEEMNLSLLSARNFPRKASQTSIFLQEWDIPFEQLEIGELIGKGRFGQVFHGRWHGEVAIRLIDIERDNEDQLKAFKREVMAYRQTRHENVVLFMGACMSPPHLAIITSLCKGRTLYSVVRDAKIVLDVNKTRQIAQEIVKGMGYLHAKGILHKDLKSKNVFYDNGKVVITDFGLFSISGVLQAGRRENKLRIQNGWLCHLAPEIIRQLSPDTEEDKLPFSKHSDVFALGTIWYELHAREWPFKTQPAEAIIWQVGSGMKPNLSQIGMGKEISDILLFCWAYEQEERPTFTKLMDMLEKLPKRNRRLSHPGHFWKSAE